MKHGLCVGDCKYSNYKESFFHCILEWLYSEQSLREKVEASQIVYRIDAQHLTYSVDKPFQGDIEFFHVVECLAHMPGVSFDK